MRNALLLVFLYGIASKAVLLFHSVLFFTGFKPYIKGREHAERFSQYCKRKFGESFKCAQ